MKLICSLVAALSCVCGFAEDYSARIKDVNDVMMQAGAAAFLRDSNADSLSIEALKKLNGLFQSNQATLARYLVDGVLSDNPKSSLDFLVTLLSMRKSIDCDTSEFGGVIMSYEKLLRKRLWTLSQREQLDLETRDTPISESARIVRDNLSKLKKLSALPAKNDKANDGKKGQ